MGFGSGYSRKSDNGGKRYNNSMTAHVWNAQSESAGQSSNGNAFFRGRALYSYGTHFVTGFIMPEGVAFLNGDSYSVATSGHQADARHAVSDRRTATVKGLTALAGEGMLLPRLVTFLDRVERVGATVAERRDMQAAVRAGLLEHTEALAAALILNPGEYPYGHLEDREPDVTPGYVPHVGKASAGEYLAGLAGLPAASWPKIQRDAAKAKAKREADANAKQTKDAERLAIYWADKTERSWREHLAQLGTDYSNRFGDLAKELKRCRSLALHAKVGKLATAKRLATLRERVKRAELERDRYDSMKAGRRQRKRLLVDLAQLRVWRDATPAERMDMVTYHGLLNLERAAEAVTAKGRLESLKNSAAKFAANVADYRVSLATETDRVRREEKAKRNQSREEAKAQWLAGTRRSLLNTFDAESGGAAMRVVSNTLETSHGAEVPLAHAVKVFRFVKLIRERGESWRRNGKTIRVGHFQVDAIEPDGSFTAGCHNFTWPEVDRVARLAGVADISPSADAVEVTS